ncbi:MAG: hypothetical protein VW270_25050 [Candidatus Poseidoniales archaeon]
MIKATAKNNVSQKWQIDILKEVTEGFPQNVYYVTKNRTKLIAYYPEGDKDAFKILDNPMTFSTRYRQFELIAKGLNGL